MRATAGGTAETAAGSGFDVWPAAVGTAIDAAALLGAALLGVVVAADVSLPGRPVLALVFFLAVPGWSALRLFGAPPSSLTLFAGVGLSVAVTLLGGELLVTRLDWAWRPATVVTCAACALALLARVVRARR